MVKPVAPPQFEEILDDLDVVKLLGSVGATHKGEYLHWDKLRHLTPPTGFTPTEWWAAMKLARLHQLRQIPLTDKNGAPFAFATPDDVQRRLMSVDQEASGRIQIAEAVTNPATRDRYIVSSLIEEAITSSQLEGASTTHEVAKKMLRTGRKPVDRSEQMIYNNYRAMELIQTYDAPLTPDFVFALHRTLIDQTLDDPSKAGRFRESSDEVVVADHLGQVVHVPPPAEELPSRLQGLCAFANSDQTDVFIHPVVRALIIHFWVGYDHPFIDGNGRTARALFYWSMLAQGYWLTEYISVSSILKNAPGQYARSFLLTETDDNDLTYFIDYQLDVIIRAIKKLHTYLRRKAAEVREVEQLLKSGDFNYRQLALLSYALKHPGAEFTIESHRRSHNVVYQTARSDLLSLVQQGYLQKRTRGRTYIFRAPHDIATRLRDND